jgi:hypothetical protein
VQKNRAELRTSALADYAGRIVMGVAHYLFMKADQIMSAAAEAVATVLCQ